VQIGPYIVEAQLGQGGAGAVYRSRDAAGHPVAIKLMLRAPGAAKARRRFEREVEALRRLEHKSVVGLREWGDHQGRPYLVTDLVDGEPLADRLAREGPLAPREAAELIRRVALALEHAHRHEVLHRDLKPDNVLLAQPDGRPVLIDFGLSADLAASRHSLTQEGSVLGTPGFFPPEQVTGDLDEVGVRSDVYGLGATLFAALTGRAPFEAKSLPELLTLTVQKAADAPSRHVADVDPELDAICLQCLAKSPYDRYPSASEVARALGRYLTAEPAPPPATSTSRPALVAASLLLLGALGAAALIVSSAQPAAQTPPRASETAPSPTPSPTVAETPQPTAPRVPDGADAFELASDAKRAGQLDDALAYFGAALERDPEHYEAYVERAGIYLDQGRLPEARGDLERALELRPGSAAAWHDRGVVSLRQGDLAGAVADFGEAIQLSEGSDASLFHARGNAYQRQGDWHAATRDFDRAVDMDPVSYVYRRDRGVARLVSGNPEGAVEDFEATRERVPASARAQFLNNYAIALTNLFRDAEAAAMREELLGLQDSAMIRSSRASNYLRLGKLREAEADLIEVTKLTKDRQKLSDALTYLARTRWQLGRSNDAKILLERAHELHPNFVTALWHYLFTLKRGLLDEHMEAPGWHGTVARFVTHQGLGSKTLTEAIREGSGKEERAGRLCEMVCYSAVMAERVKKTEQALELYRQAVATDKRDYLEWVFAQNAVARLEAESR
jgi:serine/threonine protein kinase/regulator of sirC expression with transglutaminase-like and TPR domain